MSADAPAVSENPTIGVCLSGGGFRASFYALGALRYLAESGRLERVVSVSAVSGGSIAAAAAADKWTRYRQAGGGGDAFLSAIDAPFRDTVTSSSLRRRWMLGSLLAVIPLTGGRGGAYARALERVLYDTGRVAELPKDPDWIFTSTDLTKGRAFRIAPAYTGSWDYGYIEPTPSSIKLGEAVAASAAFPPSFTVVNLRTRGLAFPKRTPPGRLSLVDGGVYDNLGLEWFQGWDEDAERPGSATRPEFTIAANASGLLAEKNKRHFPVGAFARDLSIQYQQSLNARIRWNHADLVRNPGTGVYMAIKFDPRSARDIDPAAAASALPSELVAPLALLRTDLDRFSREEADLLSYHAYWSLHALLSTYAPALAMPDPSWRQFAELTPGETDRLRRILELGSHRFFRGVRAKLGR
jgi:predicted acylesterase/phospholipase RssA